MGMTGGRPFRCLSNSEINGRRGRTGGVITLHPHGVHVVRRLSIYSDGKSKLHSISNNRQLNQRPYSPPRSTKYRDFVVSYNRKVKHNEYTDEIDVTAKFRALFNDKSSTPIF